VRSDSGTYEVGKTGLEVLKVQEERFVRGNNLLKVFEFDGHETRPEISRDT
jgi:hypothetical protein